jgi:pimeloyl-ACP methyl ester carboxylesterase
MQKKMTQATWLLGRMPWLAKPLVASLPKAHRRDPLSAWQSQFGEGLPPSDLAQFDVPAVRENILAAAVEAMRPGPAGIADELPLFLGRKWGFSPTDVRIPTWLWYGAADTVAPVQMGRYLATVLPDARLIEYPDEGHMIYVSHWREMLLALTR